MKILLQPFILLLVFITLQSCKKCEQSQVADMTFTPDELNINPYTGFERLSFSGSDGDSVVFTIGHRSIEHRRIYKYDSETAKLDHDGCQGDYFDSDNDHMTRYDDTLKTYMFINLYFLYHLSNPTNDKIINLEFGYGENPLYWFDGHFKFEADTLLPYTDSYRKDSIVAFYPEWKPQSYEFSKVYELYCNNPDTRNTEWISTAFYGMKDGLVGFKTTDGKFFYLKK